MKRRSFLLASASATLALPACRSSNNPRPPGGQGPPGGASGSASASASAGASSPTAPPDGVPVAFGKILRSNDVPVHHPILGYSTGYTTCCRFNETVVGGDIHYGFVAAIPHALAAAYVTPTTGKVRVLTVDPKTLEYATVEFNGDVPQPPGTEAPTPPGPHALCGMVVDAEFGYALVEIPKKTSSSSEAPDRVEVVKIRLSDGSIDSSATVWDKMSYYTVPNLTISLDGSHLFAVTHGRGTPGRRATGISTADLTVTYDAPADLVKDDMDHPGLIGQVLTRDGKTLTMTSLVDGSQMTFEPTQAPVAAIGQYVYVAQRPEAGASLESLSILDLTSGQSTLLEDSTLGYQAFTKASPEIVDAFFTRQYVVYLKKDEELAVYRLGEGRPLLTRSRASGAAIPAGAAAYGGYLYAAYGEDSDQLTMTDLTTGQDVGTASYTGTDIQFVSHFGALGNSCLAPATEWAAAP